jgi:hypothetical protein
MEATGLSRDALLLRLVTDHVHAQIAREPESRLVHMSSVLAWPPPALGRRGGQRDGRRRVPLRLDDEVVVAAKECAFILPGQASSRGPQHYKARPLTDAVTTALALAHPFDEVGLEDLPPILTYRQALALWRLTVAATATRAEQHALYAKGVTADILRQEDVAWHHPWRFEVAHHLARLLLAASDREENLAMLHRQGADFEAQLYDLERTDDFSDHSWLHDAPARPQDMQGRGGAAVWRADRKLAVEDISRWLHSAPRPTPLSVDRPGWDLAVPRNWVGVPHRVGDRVPQGQLADVEAGRVLRVAHGSRFTLWPYQHDGSPIRGFEHITAPLAGRVTPAAVVEMVLITTEQLGFYPRVPAAVAHELGFISQTDRDDLITRAQAFTQASIDRAMDAHFITDEERDALEAARHDVTQFVNLARRIGLRPRVVYPIWEWKVDSIADELNSGLLDADRLEYLAGAMRNIHAYALELSMRSASMTAYWQGRAHPDDEDED